MKTIDKLKQQLERAKDRQRKLFKEKAASPLEIMAKANVCAQEISEIEREIRDYAKQ